MYDYVVIGAGIAGCSSSYFLKKYNKKVLLIDKNSDVANGASGAAGAFLSPLLGKDNKFKSLVTNSLKFSTKIYKELLKDEFENCGVCRIPKDEKDKQKFETYKDSMDFEYEKLSEGYFFKIGSWVKPYEVCQKLSLNVEKKLSYKVENIEYIDGIWHINNEIKTKNIILTTGHENELIDEKYFNIRAVYGQKIDLLSSTKTSINYHKACSISKSLKKVDNKYLLSIGASHHRFEDISKYTNDVIKKDNEKLLSLASEILKLEDIEIKDVKIGARSCSTDYFPIVGKLVNSKKTIEKYPHLVNGSFITNDKLIKYENLYVLNAVGGRGFVLSLYLANNLIEYILHNKELNEDIIPDRLFKRWVKKSKLTNH